MKKYTAQKKLADLEEKRHILMNRITQWRKVQLAYLPATGSLVADIDEAISPEDIPLFLPSSLPSNTRSAPDCSKSIAHEVRLRLAQADDSLAHIRHSLRTISGLWQFKKLNISGTGNKPNTRMQDLYMRFKHRMVLSLLRYRTARTALLAVNPEGTWTDRLKDLKEADVYGPSKDDIGLQKLAGTKSGGSKGHYEISWIWLVPRVNNEPEANSSEEALDEGMRVEWSKAQARWQQWDEEVYLTIEEIDRTIIYYEWKRLWWLGRNHEDLTGDNAIQHGLTAYAQKQGYICKSIAESFAALWLPLLQSKGIVPEWQE